MRTLLLLATLGLSSSVASADCAIMGLTAKPLGPQAVVIPRDGGVVVGAVSIDRGPTEPGDVAVNKDWRLRIGTRVVTPVIDAVAPGLAVYKLPLDAESAELEDAAHAVVGKVTVSHDKLDLLPAPRVHRIFYEQLVSRRSMEHVVVDLDGERPPTAIAIVLADAKGKPRSWYAVDDGPLYAFSSHDCQILANGTVGSKQGDKVTVFWVDKAGRRSPSSKAFVIGKK